MSDDMLTIKDIAKDLNLSASTVSRVLKDSPQIGMKTKQMVLEYVKEHNYIPNRFAQNLVTQQSKTIGYMIPDISDGFYSQSAYGIESVIVPAGYDIAYHSTQRNTHNIFKFLEQAVEYRYLGVFLTPNEWTQELIEKIKVLPIPVVLLRRRTPKELEGVPSVGTDYICGMEQAVNHLASLGHKDILYIGSQDERMTGYDKAMSSCGFISHCYDTGFCFETEVRIKLGKTAMSRLLIQYPEATAVICTDDYTALGAMEALSERGITVPEKYSVVGFDNREISRLYCTNLTTVHQFQFEIGKEAAEVMLKMIHDPNYEPESFLKKPKIIVRKTSGEVRSEKRYSVEFSPLPFRN